MAQRIGAHYTEKPLYNLPYFDVPKQHEHVRPNARGLRDPLCNFVGEPCGCSLVQNITSTQQQIGGRIGDADVQAAAFHMLQINGESVVLRAPATVY
jgi:hypothetical protein